MPRKERFALTNETYEAREEAKKERRRKRNRGYKKAARERVKIAKALAEGLDEDEAIKVATASRTKRTIKRNNNSAPSVERNSKTRKRATKPATMMTTPIAAKVPEAHMTEEFQVIEEKASRVNRTTKKTANKAPSAERNSKTKSTKPVVTNTTPIAAKVSEAHVTEEFQFLEEKALCVEKTTKRTTNKTASDERSTKTSSTKPVVAITTPIAAKVSEAYTTEEFQFLEEKAISQSPVLLNLNLSMIDCFNMMAKSEQFVTAKTKEGSINQSGISSSATADNSRTEVPHRRRSQSREIKPLFLLTLDPPKLLTFCLNQPAPILACLKVTNNSRTRCAFKLNSTSHEHFQINPKLGILEIDESLTITISFMGGTPDLVNQVVVRYIKIGNDGKTAKQFWHDHEGEPDGTKRLYVEFKKDDDKKEEEKKGRKEG